HRLCPEPHVIVFRPLGPVDRISLDQSGAALPGVIDRSFEQGSGNALAPLLGGHDEADDRPDRLLIDGFHHRRPLQPGVILTRPQSYPADGSLSAIANEAGRVAAIHERFQFSAIGLGARLSWRRWPRAASAISHAPATTGDRATFRVEDR